MSRASVNIESPKLDDLRLKFERKRWNHTFQLVRRCMEKSKHKSKLSQPMIRTLKKLHEVINVSKNNMKSHLEMFARQQGVGFYTTDTAWYLTAYLLYVEVLLLPSGMVKEVNVAPHEKPPTPSEHLLQLLRSEAFTECSIKLKNLFDQYSIPGNNKVKLKLLASLQCLGMDLEQISHLPGAKFDDFQRGIINIGMVGNVIAQKEDFPLTIQFYMPQVEGLTASGSNLDGVVQAAIVTVGDCKEIHKLQMASVLQQPPHMDLHGNPVFVPMRNVPHKTFPACFQLKLQPPLPMMPSFLEKLGQITGVAMPDSNLQRAPLPKLLMRSSLSSKSHWETLDDQQDIFTMHLPDGVMHSCTFPDAGWDVPNQRGTLVDIVPFTHPAHVLALVDVLRHQCAFNTLLRSSFTPQSAGEGAECDLHFEVLPDSDASFSVTFHPPGTDSLAVLLVKVCNPYVVTCSLYGAGSSELRIDSNISTLLNRCMSIPATMRLLCSQLKVITPAPLSPSCPVATEAENDHWAPRGTAVTDTSRGPSTLTQGAAVPTDSFTDPLEIEPLSPLSMLYFL